MSYREFDFNAQYRGNPNRVDVRAPIARHIGWIKNSNANIPRDWTCPEPDNYNYAIRTTKPIYCEFINDAVFYRDLETNRWWNVFFVPKDKIEKFDIWARQQDIDFLWYHTKPPKVKPVKKLLGNRKGAELSTEERLFQMGYYAKFKNKYLTDASDKMLLDRLGPVRDCVLQGPSEV